MKRLVEKKMENGKRKLEGKLENGTEKVRRNVAIKSTVYLLSLSYAKLL